MYKTNYFITLTFCVKATAWISINILFFDFIYIPHSGDVCKKSNQAFSVKLYSGCHSGVIVRTSLGGILNSLDANLKIINNALYHDEFNIPRPDR